MTQSGTFHYPDTEATADYRATARPPQAGHAGAMARISAVLASWRAAERELNGLPDGSPDRSRLRAVVEHLRVTYHKSSAARSNDPARS
jgi:hypothetical protein